MENTSIEELNEALNVVVGYGNIDSSEYEYLENAIYLAINKLQAKHDEELEQAVVDAYVDGCDLGTYEQNTKEAKQYYEANFKTKEL
jgi:hypothetical protein